jgi:HEAT repeat protein
MGKVRRIFPVALLLVLLGGFTWAVLRAREPAYQGRSLPAWLHDYAASTPYFPPIAERFRDQAETASHAIQQIGTNALPTLIRMLQAKDSPLKRQLIRLAGRQSFIRVSFRQPWESQLNAASGFFLLGDAARPALPALVEFLRTSEESPTRMAAVVANSLARIAPEGGEILAQALTNASFLQSKDPVDCRRCAAIAIWGLRLFREDPNATPEQKTSVERNIKTAVPALLEGLKDPDVYVRQESAIALGFYGDEAEKAVPALAGCLQDTSWEVAYSAADALAKLKGDAKAAVPALRQALHNRDPRVRESVTKALNQISPAD